MIPVAEEAVLASTVNAGLVVPLGPTANAVAEAEVIVVAAAPKVDEQVTALVRVIAPVDVPPRVIVPAPLASIVRLSSVPELVTDTARPPAAAALFTFRPVAAEDVEASTVNEGFVDPEGPATIAVALDDVIVCAVDARVELQVTALVKVIAPVEVPPSVMVPAPLASMVRFSSVPLEITATASPPAAAADVTESPVAALEVFVTTLSVGLVVPFGPTTKAVALETLTTVARLEVTLPVPVALRVIVPDPLASMVRFSFDPELITATASPPAAAAPVTERPVAQLEVEQFTFSVGFVVPAGPTAIAFAFVDVPTRVDV